MKFFCYKQKLIRSKTNYCKFHSLTHLIITVLSFRIFFRCKNLLVVANQKLADCKINKMIIIIVLFSSNYVILLVLRLEIFRIYYRIVRNNNSKMWSNNDLNFLSLTFKKVYIVEVSNCINFRFIESYVYPFCISTIAIKQYLFQFNGYTV